MQDHIFAPDFIHSNRVILLRHIYDVACDALRDRVTDASKARMHNVVGLAIVDLARRGQADPDHLLNHALARARAALN